MYNILRLLIYEPSPVSLYLKRDNKLGKAAKHEITNVLEEKLEAPPINYVLVCDVKMAIFFAFMPYERKVGTEKLKTFGDFVDVLWKIISFLSKDAQLIFDLYLENSIKYGERTRRQKATAIDVIIEKDSQYIHIYIYK